MLAQFKLAQRSMKYDIWLKEVSARFISKVLVQAQGRLKNLLCVAKTYLLRQIISADVEGCGAFGSFDLEVDVDEDVVIVGVDGIVGSEASSSAGVLFFFFAIAHKSFCVPRIG